MDKPKPKPLDRLLAVSIVLLQLVVLISARTRKYYIAAVERNWDYAPSGMNNVKGIKLEDDSDASIFTTRSAVRIGREYRKVLYREFEDDTFEKEIAHTSYLGFLGPRLVGEVGDTIEVLFKNKASREYTMHPHGVFYDKASEGALYEDKTSGNRKKDDHVQPGETHLYRWLITENHAPTDGDDNCLTWMYHSHVIPSKDTNTGLIGPLLTCKKGTLMNGKRNDVDKDFTILFTVLDENESWLLDENIQKFASAAASKTDDEDFQESNKMHVINGYFYGNLPDMKLCRGDHVSWHLFGIGNEVDIHTAYFHGQSFAVQSHRKDVATILPATFVTATMRALNPGTWMLNCLVDDHYNAGMYALFSVDKCSHDVKPTPLSGGKLRKYFIAAEEILWDYGPSGFNNMTGKPLTEADSAPAVFFDHGRDRIGGKYWKALYVEYTDPTFTTKKVKPKHLGFLGPIIRAEVGDTIEVVFKNNASQNYSIQPHGVFFNKSSEGALYRDNTSTHQKRDDVIPPGGMYTYRWTVPEHVGPTQRDAQCVTWMYSSAVDPVRDTFSGLIGPLLTCKKGTLSDSGHQKNVDKEFFLLFTVTDENNAWYIDRNKLLAVDPPSIQDDDGDFAESNTMHGINGFLYGNLPGLRMCKGDEVSWHLIGLGNEVDIHGAYFYGNTFLDNNNRKDTVNLLPGTFATLRMTPDNPGTWAIVCKTNDHYSAGMQARYDVIDCKKGDRLAAELNGKLRPYFIAAVEREWDYAPSGKDQLLNKRLEDVDDAKVFAANGDTRIGRKYKKALFREFTDSSFTKEKPRTRDSEAHLGVLGPIIYAEVGDTIEVVFKNKAAKQTYSMHPNGLLYGKEYEGSNYKDNTTGDQLKDNGIAPGETFKYIWKVPERSGPSDGDTSCITWAYFSDVNPIKDTNSGLVGPLVICRKGTLSDTMKRKDVDKAFAVFFSVLDENESWYLDDNIKYYCSKPGSVDKEDEDFQESNKMHGINGYIFGNMPGLKMNRNEKVDWYLISLGNEVDMHTVHFHGQTFLKKSLSYHREDVYDVFPGSFATLEMKPDSIGTWMLHCHVNDHMTAGMIALFEVGSAPSEPTHSSAAREKAQTHRLGLLAIAHVFLGIFRRFRCYEIVQ